jgi:hypothetical protein
MPHPTFRFQFFLAFAILVALSIAFTGSTKAGPKCPLPDNYLVSSTSTSSTSTDPNSPEKPKNLQAVCHNGKILCLPPEAVKAHMQHGDALLGPCTKEGNNGPCP